MDMRHPCSRRTTQQFQRVALRNILPRPCGLQLQNCKKPWLYWCFVSMTARKKWCILNFSTQLTLTIRIGFMQYPTRLYIPHPLLLLQLWQVCTPFDAPQQKLALNVLALATVKTTDPFCVNCKGPHDCASKEYAAFKLEKNVMSKKWKRTFHFWKPEPGLIKRPMHRSLQPVQITQLISDPLFLSSTCAFTSTTCYIYCNDC